MKIMKLMKSAMPVPAGGDQRWDWRPLGQASLFMRLMTFIFLHETFFSRSSISSTSSKQ